MEKTLITLLTICLLDGVAYERALSIETLYFMGVPLVRVSFGHH